jgi:antitoxin component YwqK of YwqJK toxin-antitoxin module
MLNELKCEQEFWDNGNIRREWRYNSAGWWHNESGPAHRWWRANGQPEYEAYWINDRLHNASGPAVRKWHANGRLEYEEYWLNGRQLNYQALLHECSVIKESSC